MFKLESIFAYEGDCLLLHYGDDQEPLWILIDGGAKRTYAEKLRPRLAAMAQALGGPVPLGMVMISHVDGDHIKGILDLFKELRAGTAEPPCTIDVLWHNSFDDIIGNEDEELVTKLLTPPADAEEIDADVLSVVQPASVNQGRNLRLDAEALAMVVNDPFDGLVQTEDGPPTALDQGAGLTFKVLGPDKTRLEAFQSKWNEFLREKDLAQVEAASFTDKSVPNLASIVVLAERDGKSMLLTGDARGDDIVNGLVDGGLLDAAAGYPKREDFPEGRTGSREWKRALNEADAVDPAPTFPVDLLKAPHHGSDRNVTEGFFRRVPATHYVISADGNHGNPDVPTLEWIAKAKNGEPYTLHFSFTADQHETTSNAEFAEALEKVHHWVTHDKPDNCTVIHRANDALSTSIDLDG